MDFRGEGRGYQPSLTEYKRAYYITLTSNYLLTTRGGEGVTIRILQNLRGSGKFYCDMVTRQNPPTLPSLGRVRRSDP